MLYALPRAVLLRVPIMSIALAGSTPALAEIVYQPTSPSFGGNPFNSSHLLGIANAQNTYTDPKATTSNSNADLFARQLQSRLLSALSSQITDAIFGANPQERGTITFGGQTISFVRSLESVQLAITNNDSGEVTNIEIPTFVKVN